MSLNAKLHQEQSEQESPSDNKKLFVNGVNGTRVHYNPSEAPSFDEEEQAAIMLSPASKGLKKAKRSFWFRVAQTCGILGSIAWGLICVTYLLIEGGLATQTPYELGIFVAGMLAPVAFYWMLLSYLQRNSDVQYYAESLRSELHTLFFPSEEDSQLVNKDIERMTLQAAELASSSKAVLKSIQRTRQGLRHEIKEFASFASKAEGHLISLSDKLVTRTGSINELVDTIDSRVNDISDKSEKSIKSWDDASAKMLERAGDIEGTMDEGANRILEMADVALDKSRGVSEMFDGTITSLGLTVDAVIDRLSGMNEEFGAYTRTLSISTEELSKETSRIGVMIEDHTAQLQNVAGRSAETITQSLICVSDNKEALEETIEAISSQTALMSTAINNSVTELVSTADNIVSRAEATGEKLSDKTNIISNSLDGLEEQINRIDTVSEIASHRLAEGIDTAVQGSNQISDAIRRGVETLTRTSEDATAEATSLIEATLSHIQQLKETGQGNVSSVESMVKLLEQSRKQIESASASSQIHVETLTKSVETQSQKLGVTAASLADEVKAVSRALEEPLHMVGVALADADSRHLQIQDTLERRVHDLREASDKATESVEVIRQSLREQTNDISSLSGRVTAQAKTLNVELNDNKEQLTETIDSTLNHMNRLISDLSVKTSTIGDYSDQIKGDLLMVNQNIDESVVKLGNVVTSSSETFDGTKSELNNVITYFEEKLKKSEQAIEIANQKLISSSETILPLYDRVEIGSNKALESLNLVKDNYETATELTLSKIEMTSLEFDKNLNKLQIGAGEASNILRNTSEDLRGKLTDIEQSASSANEKMRGLSSAMDGQSSDIHILTDQAVLKIENVQKLMNEQFREMSESVGLAVSQIENAGLSFDTHANKISVQSEDILNRFTAAGDEAQAKAYELKQASYNISDTTKDAVANISDQMELLNGNSENSLSNLRKTSDSLSIKSKEIDTMMQSVLSKAKSYADNMREQVRDVAEQSDQSSTVISKSISALLGTMDDVNNKTKSVVSYISETNQSLYDQSGRFVTAVAKSAQAAEHATDMFSKQTNNMLKAAAVAVEKSQDIEKTELRVGRENFLNSARFVLESLHSLSVDFVRMIDGDVSEKDWKSYQKGDVAVFTSKLVDRLGDMPADKVRTKYADDTEFRNYVQKFMRQFEDVLEQTDSVDRGAVLGTTFAASDVGKIYRYLSNVTGRKNKTA